jgi:methylated-DNA-protein-cysteine methyltransferase-like protein
MNQEFSTAVYQIVGSIPEGKVLCYGDIARLAGYPRHARFVGRLLAKLPADSKLPWHRVLRADGRPGFPDATMGRHQLRKLATEGVSAVNGRVAKGFFWKPAQ